jgi:diguanylate cyclase (GGDEF)-like protein
MVARDRLLRLDLLGYLDGVSKAVLVGFGLVLVGLSGVLQYLGGHLAFLIYYLVPVGLVAWFVGLWPGMFVAAMSGAVSGGAWWLVSHEAGPPPPPLGVSPVTVTVQLLFFLLVLAYILTALNVALTRAEHLARTDYLTGVANSRYFFELASAELNRSQRYVRPLTVAYIDVDDLKPVNDRLGHGAGDTLLRVVAESIRARVRKSDVVARLGGDEFALMLPEAGYEAASAAVRKIHASLVEVMQNRGWRVTFSIGAVTCVSPPDTTLEELIRVADGLMYSVKRSGKNQIRHEILGKPASRDKELSA